jgi:flagellar hook-associated protein 3 FlgL
MTAIRPFAAGSYATSRTTAQLTALKSQLDTLSTQLASGRTADTYGGLGTGRVTALATQGTISALDGYNAIITTGQTRAKLAVTSLTQVATLGTSALTSLQSGTLTGAAISGTAAKTLALSNLDSALDALNQSAGGVYLFGGRNTSTQPVLATTTILDGTTSASGTQLAGLRTVAAEQVKADLGTGGTGRVSVAQPTTTSVSLTEDASGQARANFGFSITKVATTGTALTATTTAGTPATATASFAAAPTEGQRFRVVVNQADGSQKTIDFTTTAGTGPSVENPFPVTASPAAAKAALDALVAPGTLASVQSAATGDTPPGPGLSLAFTGGSAGSATVGLGGTQPAVGDTVTVTLALHDGTSTTLTLTAAASATAGSTTTFAIGADPAATAGNIAAALGNALKDSAGTTLTASATARAAQDFFSGSTTAGLAPRRIAFDGSGNATGYAQTPSDTTVVWYQGEDSGSAARATQTLQVGTSATVQIGARANEAPIRSVLAGLAALAVGLPAAGDANGTATYQAIAARATPLLSSASTSPSVQDAVTDVSRASAQMAYTASANASTKAALQDTLDGIEQASTQEVAAKLLEVQNRLQASYQITASLSKLSLVNYLG